MAVKRCPKCRLVHPESATHCDCGRSFVDGSIGEPLKLVPDAPDPSPEQRRLKHLHEVSSRILMASGGFLTLSLLVVVVGRSSHVAQGIGTALAMIGVIGLGVGRMIWLLR